MNDLARYKREKIYYIRKKRRAIILKYPRKFRRRKQLRAKPSVRAYERRILRQNLLPHKIIYNNRLGHDGNDAIISQRRFRYPSFVRKNPFWSFRRSYDEGEEPDYDYVFPIELQTGDGFWNTNDDSSYNRRHYLPLERNYGYGGGGYGSQRSSHYLLPIFGFLGLLGIVFNLGLGKTILQCSYHHYILKYGVELIFIW